ncbi:hypothetical protein [Nocardiopsis alkaliphila]|uniref:hypothetical protein n=1 Tax=Nocardiopsis alkaliphila TaxID=225762 RepID=UPI00034A3CAB|nr:hypothetical protein [Nocardiopsis alkaliphila]
MSDPITAAIVTALATGSSTKISEALGEGAVAVFKSLYKAVNKRFRSTPEAQEALEDLRLDSGDAEALADATKHLERAASQDPKIGRLLHELRSEVVQEGDGTVNNQIHGNVGDNARVFQGRDFHGDIRF